MKASTHCLRTGVYGTPGHQRSGLYREYQKLHPNIEIVPTASRSQASYRRALRAHLACGNRADCQRLASQPATGGPFEHIWPAAPASMTSRPAPLDEISTVTVSGAAAFIPRNTLGAGALQGGWLSWAGPEATTASGQTLGLGADASPMAICDRPSLLREAGRPASRTALARQWSTWPGYIQVGERFAAHAPAGTAFMDSVAGLGNAMVRQAHSAL